MKRLRRVFFWTHLVAALLAGVVILIMSFTGAALALKPQIVKAIDRDVRVVDPAGRAPRALSELVAAAAVPGKPISSVVVERDPAASVAVTAGTRTVYVDPYTATILGEASPRAQAFFRSLENWHRWIALSGDQRATGRAVTGAANLVFLGLALSGLYLWWPHAWTPQHTRAILAFRRTATGRARDFNWHNVIGFWCLVPIVIMTASGAVISYPWASRLVYRVTGSEPPAPASAASAPARGASAATSAPAAAAFAPDQLDRAWSRAQSTLPTWRSATLRVPSRPGAPFALTLSDGASWNRFARSQLTIDASTAEVRQWTPYASTSLGQRARGWLRFAHTGELGGLTGQIVAGIGCVGGVLLVWTGVSLSIRRFAAWRGRARSNGARSVQSRAA